MSDGTSDDCEWAIEKREFLADARDTAGDERDAAAEARDSAADARDDRLDEREKRLDAPTLTSGVQAALLTHGDTAQTGNGTSLELLDPRLQSALLSRDVIGQAKGILMERLKRSPDEAFEMLKKSSQRLNLKLREVARRLADTGELPSDRPRAALAQTEPVPRPPEGQ
jgi:ANTAR domain